MLTGISAFPPARDHHRVGDLLVANDSFFLNRWPFESQAERDFFANCEYGSWMTKIIPDGDFEKMVWACRVNTLLFLTDDMIDIEPLGKGLGLTDRIAGIIRGEIRPVAGSIAEEMLNRALREMEASTRTEIYQQFSRLACGFLKRQHPVEYTDISTYLDFRCWNGAGYSILALARYAIDIYITDEELGAPMLEQCERLALEALMMENDVASYAKEVEQNSLGSNLVALLLQHGIDGQTFGSASEVQVYIRDLIADTEARLHGAISDALEHPSGISDAVQRWLHALPYIVSGNTWWSQHTRRYNTPGNPVPRRVIHMECEGDIIVPEPQFTT